MARVTADEEPNSFFLPLLVLIRDAPHHEHKQGRSNDEREQAQTKKKVPGRSQPRKKRSCCCSFFTRSRERQREGDDGSGDPKQDLLYRTVVLVLVPSKRLMRATGCTHVVGGEGLARRMRDGGWGGGAAGAVLYVSHPFSRFSSILFQSLSKRPR